MPEINGKSYHSLIVLGVSWNALSQVLAALLNFVAMLLLVRIISPAEYGQVGVVVGLLTLFNSLSSGMFVTQALQLPGGVEPDWSLHWSAGLYIQCSLSAMFNVLAGLCWLADDYRPIAPLLHLATIGLLLDWPNQIGATMLRRSMDFKRLRIIHALGTFVSVATTVVMALAGWGAYAIVIGSNVLTALPFTIDLLFIRRWRPRGNWWRWPDWEIYRPAMRFGLQQASSGLLHGAPGALAAAVLPGVLGFTAIGLWDRARALYNTTVGRVWNILGESVYPLLPRYAADVKRYPHQATLFCQVILLIILPGALYVGLEGIALSRLFYGEKWIGVDPLIWPGAIAGLGFSIFGVGWTILIAANRLRACFYLDIVAACLSAPLVGVVWAGGGLHAYAWAIAAAQIVAGAIALSTASSLLVRDWLRVALLPAVICSLLALGSVLLLQRYIVNSNLPMMLCMSTAVYALVILITLRGLFPQTLESTLCRLPGGPWLRSWLRLPTPSIELS